MDEQSVFAYRLGDFGADFPADPVACVQTATSLTVSLTRAAQPVQITLNTPPNAAATGALPALVEPVRIGGNDYPTGTQVAMIWTLVDGARAIRMTAYHLSQPDDAGGGATVITAPLPLTPGQSYDLSLPVGPGTGMNALTGGFAAGTRVLTQRGKHPIEDIAVGDKVWTETGGFAPVLWHGVQTLSARGLAAPVRLRRGLLGLTEDLRLAGAQGVKIQSANGPVLIPAAALEKTGMATRDFGTLVTWHQILLPGHAVIYAHGLPCESVWAPALLSAGRPPDWPTDYVVPDAPVHPRLSVKDAAEHVN